MCTLLLLYLQSKQERTFSNTLIQDPEEIQQLGQGWRSSQLRWRLRSRLWKRYEHNMPVVANSYKSNMTITVPCIAQLTTCQCDVRCTQPEWLGPLKQMSMHMSILALLLYYPRISGYLNQLEHATSFATMTRYIWLYFAAILLRSCFPTTWRFQLIGHWF